jgi:hypothetical protein
MLHTFLSALKRCGCINQQYIGGHRPYLLSLVEQETTAEGIYVTELCETH